MQTKKQLIEALTLLPHPEGGYYAETYRDVSDIGGCCLARGARSTSTAIYFLLAGQEVSHFHRIASDELWHFYDGAPLAIHCISPQGKYELLTLGLDLAAGQRPQHCVKAGTWFGASLALTSPTDNDFSLVGCTVAPGFDFQDFELAGREQLLDEFPEYGEIITRLT